MDPSSDQIGSLVGAGFRLLAEGEPRRPGDELILRDTDGTVRYWPWDPTIDAAIQGPIGPCAYARRRVDNDGKGK